MAYDLKKPVSNYFKKKKPLSIIFDAVFIIVILLFLIPATRQQTAAFFIRMTSFPASALDAKDQFGINTESEMWQLHDIEGNTVTLGELNNKPVFLNIWATWCPPCVAELPGIQDLYHEFGNDVNFVFVSNESREKIREFAKKHDYEDLPFFISGTMPRDFLTNSIPTTYIIDKKGVVRLRKQGAARWNASKTETLLKQLIKE